MIDIRAARNDPERFRAALARRGAAEAFDALMAADARWRELVPQVDELRAQQKLQGKPTPEQLEELKARKARLNELEAELAAAEAERDAALAKVPNPPHESAADGMTEDDAVEIKRWGEPPKLAEPKEHTEIGRFELERAAKVSGSRFGFLVGDTALVALALYRFALDRLVREGFTAVLPPVLVREDAMYGTGFFPSDKSDYYEIPADGLYLVGTSEVPLVAMHMDEILDDAAVAVLRVLVVLPARVGRGRSRHARDVPRAPVPEGRDGRVHGAGRSRGTSTSGCSRSRSRWCRSSGSRTAS